MTPAIEPGATVRLRPGLRNKPYSACTGRVVEVVNDRLKVRVGVLEHWVTREEIVR
jgi:hypothetical protein